MTFHNNRELIFKIETLPFLLESVKETQEHPAEDKDKWDAWQNYNTGQARAPDPANARRRTPSATPNRWNQQHDNRPAVARDEWLRENRKFYPNQD